MVAGTIYLNTGGVRLNVARTIMHPLYQKSTISNDIGLVQTTQFFVYNYYVQPIALPSWNIGSGYTMTASGWGLLTVIAYKYIIQYYFYTKLPFVIA